MLSFACRTRHTTTTKNKHRATLATKQCYISAQQLKHTNLKKTGILSLMPPNHNEATRYYLTSTVPFKHAFQNQCQFSFKIHTSFEISFMLTWNGHSFPKQAQANTEPLLKAARLEWLLLCQTKSKTTAYAPSTKPCCVTVATSD